MISKFEEIKNKANIVRDIDLKEVVKLIGCVNDKSDPAKWHTCQGTISIASQKFMNWSQGIGGGGAIDLVIHLKNFKFTTAVIWLWESFSVYNCQKILNHKKIKNTLQLPAKDQNKISKIKSYLNSDRCIPMDLINFLINSGKLYSDKNSNAVFLLLGKEKQVVGAEIRGINNQWHSMAKGSRKDLGCFYIKKAKTKKMVICESAIDAISCFVINNVSVLSTSGANANPKWLEKLITLGFEFFCGFDSDKIGEEFSRKMIRSYTTIKRLRPTNHDWNEDLISIYNHQ